jgi:hypothetical protein
MKLTVRAYNVGHGDCILISWDETDRAYHAWVDFGTHFTDDRSSYPRVTDDIRNRTGGHIDLLLVTHRHQDHFHGFYTMRERLRAEFTFERIWHAHVTAHVEHRFDLASAELTRLLPLELRSSEGYVGSTYRSNLSLTNAEAMDEIIELVPPGNAHAIHREVDLDDGALPPGFARMRIEVLAPEKDSGVYLEPIDTSLAVRESLDRHLDQVVSGPISKFRQATIDELADAVSDERIDFLKLADFARLRRQLRSSGTDLLAAVNTSRNNTSLVTRWTWRDVTLLLTGDAELESWALMRQRGSPLGSTLVKVGHHGSINASPTWGYLAVFPSRRNSNSALLSTNPEIFDGENEVPKAEVVEGWLERMRWASRMKRTDSVPRGDSVALEFDR